MALASTALANQTDNRVLRADERVSLASSLLLGWQIAMEEYGDEIFDDAAYDFIPTFIALAHGLGTYWHKSQQLVLVHPAHDDGAIQRRIGPFPTISIPVMDDLLIDNVFYGLLETSIPNISENIKDYFVPAQMNVHYYPVQKEFQALAEKSFAAFSLGFEATQPQKGGRIAANEDDKKETASGSQHFRLKWFEGAIRFSPY